MKNFIKLFGVIALVAVIGFSMASCKDPNEGSGITVKVVNNHATLTITGVIVGPSSEPYFNKTGLSIAPGGTDTFTFNIDKDGAWTNLYLTTNDNVKRSGDCDIWKGKTTTATLTSTGTVSATIN